MCEYALFMAFRSLLVPIVSVKVLWYQQRTCVS